MAEINLRYYHKYFLVVFVVILSFWGLKMKRLGGKAYPGVNSLSVKNDLSISRLTLSIKAQRV